MVADIEKCRSAIILFVCIHREPFRLPARNRRVAIVAASRSRPSKQSTAPMPPPKQAGPIIHGDRSTLQHWLMYYWEKLQLPAAELRLLAITQDRQQCNQ